jgi:prepilin-type N-terminal cleavage/methylation domain-containing protein
MLVTRSVTTTAQRASSSARAARRGFTLGEVVVALLLFSIVGGGILSLVMRQQRFYRSTAEVIKVQGQLRQGASLLPADLRGISTSDVTVNDDATVNNADIYTRADWHLEFRRTFGGSVVCRRTRLEAPQADTLTLPPKVLGSGISFTNWGIAPQVGDSVLVLDDWTMVGPGDDRWRAYEVTKIEPVTGVDGCPWKNQTPGDSTPLLYESDNARPSFKITLDTTLRRTIIVGAPVRFFRRVRYEIYQAPDQQWYLGYSDCLRTYDTWNQCSEVTPVSGPYSPYTGIASENGLHFAYYDGNGGLLDAAADSRGIARVDVVLRGVTANNVTRTGSGPGEQYRDSLVFSVGIRNRR